LLAHKAWGILPLELWKLSLKAYESRTRWLDIMAVTPQFMPLHNWLITTASLTTDIPLEQILDVIIGKPDHQAPDDNSTFVSPLYDYFFSKDKLDNNPDEYLTYLEALRAIRTKLREYRPDHTPTLLTFIEFVALNRKIGSTISVIRSSIQSDNAVNVMTAHKSKGLEFNTVYVMNAVDTIWGERARSRNRLISYPENLPLAPAGESDDERLRLFYVAITRAKQQLHISYSLSDDNGKNTLRAAFLVKSKWNLQPISSPTTEQIIEATELAWYQTLVNPTTVSMRNLLLPTLENYKLSVTHLHNFLDVTRGGPSTFLLHNLLRFPQAKSPNAAFGTAIHDTLQRAHAYLVSTGDRQAIEDIVSNFESNLRNQHMTKQDYATFLQKGGDALRIFLDNRYESFTASQQTELDFTNQHSMIDNAHLTGKLDLAEINKTDKSIIVTDYKTGKPSLSWAGKADYEKIKLHKYKQQLMFYKLLVENARDYRGYEVKTGIMQFVEPTISGDILMLDAEFSSNELDRFSKLINAVWSRIITLDLPDILNYDSSYKGILAFEQDLIDNTV
jgi:DNA helicase-2/ATP-dependent DNA helicase PcrA